MSANGFDFCDMASMFSRIYDECPPDKKKQVGLETFFAGLNEHREKFGSLKWVDGPEYVKWMQERWEFAYKKVQEYYKQK